MTVRLMLTFLLSSLILIGCATTPPAIQRAPVPDLQLGEVRKAVAQYQGSAVRWGGSILEVENEQNETWIQVLQYPLWHYGKPRQGTASQGRFVIHSMEFLDPAIYKKGRLITVAGSVDGEVERLIGKNQIKLPVINTTSQYLWIQNQNSVYPYYSRYNYPGSYYSDYRSPYRSGFYDWRYRSGFRGFYSYCD